MTTLYIIGNGFDLWHGLPTNYGSFYEFAKDSLDELDAYYVADDSVDRRWHDFENYLGKYDHQLLYDEIDDIDVTSESFRPKDAYGLEDELEEFSENLVDSIENLFHDWAFDIDLSEAAKKITFDSPALFLTFNYTNTVQQIYGIADSDVFHIHGSSKKDDKLIFGHGESREEAPEIDENGDSNRTMFTDAENAAKYPFYAFQKPVLETINNNRNYFISLRLATRVVVIGHSLNEIDLPYFHEVAKNTIGCNWFVYCYETSDEEHHRSQLIRCGVDASRIKTCEYS